jgi:hypothetical protein
MADDLSAIVDTLTPEELLDVAFDLIARRPPVTDAEIMAGIRLAWWVGAGISPAPPAITTTGA